jgi:hypothetical protein
MIETALAPRLSRMLAIGLLAALVVGLAMMLSGSLAGFLDKWDTIALERRRVSQFGDRLQAVSQIEALGAILKGPSRDATMANLMGTVIGMVPQQSFQATSLQPQPTRPAAPGLLELMIDARATASGVRALVEALEKSGQAIFVSQLVLTPEKPALVDGPPDVTIFAVHMMITAPFAAEAAKK